MGEIIEKELSYKIVGFCMKIHSELGKSCKEKYYQRALELLFVKENIKFFKEIKVDLNFVGEKLGNYFLDFLIDDKVIVELKAKPFLNKSDYNQVLSYLKFSNVKLGLLINFGADSLDVKRVLNNSNTN